MPTETYPHEHAPEAAAEATAYSFCETGVVNSAPTQDQRGQHHVTVSESRVPADQPVPVVPSVTGSYFVPPEGAPVLLAYLEPNTPVVIGAPIPDVDTPDVTPGERIVSHPASTATVRFAADGTIHINGDPDLVVNGGTRGIVTDVTTTKDADGHVTSISVERDSSILIP